MRDMSEPAASAHAAAGDDEEPDMERVAAVAEAYGCELLG